MKTRTIFIFAFIGYLLIQFLYVAFSSVPFVSDSQTYLTFAQSAIQEGTYYPNPSSIFSAWLAAPVYINWLILLQSISQSTVIILLFNIVLNTIQMVLLYKVTEKMFGIRAAGVATILYMLYLNNLGLVLLNLTELPFGIFVLASIYFFISPASLRNGLLCGLMAGLALGVRPTAWALILAFLIIYIIHAFHRRAQYVQLIGISLGILLYIIPMGILSKRNIGRFEFLSTTGPANLIMSANPNAKGVFDAQFFHTDSVYLTKKTYVERNEYLLSSSKKYIRENPGKWIGLIPRKLYSTFISDGWAIPRLLNSLKLDLNGYLKGKKEFKDAWKNEPALVRFSFWVLNGWQQVIYGIIFVFFIYQLYRFLTGKYFSYESLLINLFVAGGLGLTILSSVGNPRYKYNFLIVGIILISPYVLAVFDKVRRKLSNLT